MFKCTTCPAEIDKPRIREAKPYCESCWRTAFSVARHAIAVEEATRRIASGRMMPGTEPWPTVKPHQPKRNPVNAKAIPQAR